MSEQMNNQSFPAQGENSSVPPSTQSAPASYGTPQHQAPIPPSTSAASGAAQSGTPVPPASQPTGAIPHAAQPTASMPRMPQPGYSAPQTTASFSPSAVTAAATSPAHKHAAAKTFGLGFAGAAVACVLAGALMFGTGALKSGNTVVLGSSNGNDSAITATSESADLAEQVADKTLPSVVAITTYVNQSSGFFNSQSSGLTESGLGSGVIISADGYILTNNHVVSGSDQLTVNANGEEYQAQVVGTDPTTDLAVVKIDASGLTPIEIGDSSELEPGQWVMTVGSPFGLEQSVATGIVSATSRTVQVGSSSSPYGSSGDTTVYTNMIQTDAAINPGNSGGALVDKNGKLIGINSVIESYSGNYSGVGFAIPVNYAISIAQQIIKGETPTHAQLGVSPISVNAQLNARYKLGSDSGAYVQQVTPGSGAEAAGLQQGDIITKVDSTTIEDASSLIAAVRSHAVGDSVSITYLRDGNTQTTNVTLGSDGASSQQKLSLGEQLQRELSGSSSGRGSGTSFESSHSAA